MADLDFAAHNTLYATHVHRSSWLRRALLMHVTSYIQGINTGSTMKRRLWLEKICFPRSFNA